MKNKISDTLGRASSDLQSMTSVNQSFNEKMRHAEFTPEERTTCWQKLKSLPVSILISLIVCPLLFILIGMIYRNSCVAQPDVPLFLIIFGCLILVNLLVYTLVGTTFLAFVRRARSFSLEQGGQLLVATLSGTIFGMLIFIWWIVGTIWWIKLTLAVQPQLQQATSLAFCHPVVYWTAFAANVFGLIGFIGHICIAIGVDATANKQSSSRNRA